ncbi:uncharacterized protein EV420DRAFT_1477781 [Desarmillaria tabescens]|uniref:DUF6532 domain-containing protein n=1 Tax=Armillaria tabescens TaxID=1929756 RepID=A0AA39N8D1_ARMTA|nr:uncharacterized protein EV420DRAFT_1477781 [Desarmillaria tabescens]KAK0460893.1 hypothetical protein EV420DRAFT_1477781 [Desarmillaria tabescens]
MNTHGAKANVPDELKKHTRQEQREAREAKQWKQEEAKVQKKEVQDGKKKRMAMRVAAQEDKQLLEDKAIQSLRPDLDTSKSLPKVSQQSVASVLRQSPAIMAWGPSVQAMSKPTASVATASSKASSVSSPIPSPAFDLAIPALDDNDDAEGDILPSMTTTHTSESEGSHPDDLHHDGGSDIEDMSTPDVLSIQVDLEDDTNNDTTSSDEYQQPESSVSGSEDVGQMDIDEEFTKFLEMKWAKMAASKKKPQEEKKTGKVLPKPATIMAPKKRKEVEANSDEQTNQSSQKRVKTTEVGGLAKDWRGVYAQSMAMSSASSLGDPIELPAQVGIKVEKGSKRGKDADKKANPPEIVLQEADVQAIDKQEHGKKVKWKNQHLPFDNIMRDLPIWQQKFILSLLDWAMSDIPEPFGMTSHPNFKATIQGLWKKIFSHLSEKHTDDSKPRADHPAIYSVGAAAIRTHRSDIGKEALRTVEHNWECQDMKKYATVEERSAWVTDQLKGSKFLYQYPEKEDNRGAFREPLILETFAYHLQATMNTPHGHGNPVAGLAVAASAVKHALTLWKSGTNSVKSSVELNSKNNTNSFKDDPWGTTANKYYKHVCDYDDEKWREIIFGSAKHFNAKKVKLLGAMESSGSAGRDDSDDNISKSP